MEENISISKELAEEILGSLEELEADEEIISELRDAIESYDEDMDDEDMDDEDMDDEDFDDEDMDDEDMDDEAVGIKKLEENRSFLKRSGRLI